VPYNCPTGKAPLRGGHPLRAGGDEPAERLGSDNPRARTVGFALTVLQRRLASSTHAILRSLQRRRERLETKRREMLDPGSSGWRTSWRSFPGPGWKIPTNSTPRRPSSSKRPSSMRHAAQTIAELDIEIAQLTELVALAARCATAARTASGANCAACCSMNPTPERGRAPQADHLHRNRDTLTYLVSQIRNVWAAPTRGDHPRRHPA